jgi:transcription initiation factor TFIIIB Brf1 subunit/transcription initiation factor TFIIB
MPKMTSQEQIEDWETELASASAEQKWRRALQLCSWLRYALDQQGRSDPEVERIHDQAKKALAEQVSRERAQQARLRQRQHSRRVGTNQIILGNWLQALDAIEAFYQSGASQEETFDLLKTLQDRLADRLNSAQQPTGAQATELRQRFSKLLEQVRSNA